MLIAVADELANSDVFGGDAAEPVAQRFKHERGNLAVGVLGVEMTTTVPGTGRGVLVLRYRNASTTTRTSIALNNRRACELIKRIGRKSP